ncbi:MAG: hypothetical protein KAJ98_10320 [Spirochaetaceae bacterium]|nr:hypothetical protein [Spirochaetaceae bacterium]
MKPFIRIAIFIIVVLLLFSCSGTSPVIDEIQWRVLYRDDGQNRYEELSMFIRVSDPDGSEDPALITVSAGTTGLVWRFPVEEWISGTRDGAEWWGLPSMIPLFGFRLPDTLYTLRLEDLAGRSDEITFRPDPNRPSIENLKWPEVLLQNDTLLLEGPYESGSMILRDGQFNSVGVQLVSTGYRINDEEAVWWELWFPLNDTSGGFRLGPYPVSIPEAE